MSTTREITVTSVRVSHFGGPLLRGTGGAGGAGAGVSPSIAVAVIGADGRANVLGGGRGATGAWSGARPRVRAREKRTPGERIWGSAGERRGRPIHAVVIQGTTSCHRQSARRPEPERGAPRSWSSSPW